MLLGIDGKVKAAFTRAYNKEAHLTPYAAGLVKVGRSKGTAATDELEALEGLDGDDVVGAEDEENDDDPTLDAMIKVKKSTKKDAAGASKKKSETTAKATRAGSSRGRGRGKKTAE